MTTIKISELPTWTPTTDDILVFVDRADWVTKQADNSEYPVTFLWLTDTPSSYSWQALKLPRVNVLETAIEFYTPSAGWDMLASTYDPAGIAQQVAGLTATQTFSTGLKTFLSGMFGLRNVANSFTSFFTNTNTASRTYTLQNADWTLAFTSDITGTNSGTNTGDEPSASLTVEWVVELATTAEINTGTDSTRAMPIDQYVASNRNVRYVQIDPIAWTADNAVGTKTGDITYRSLFTGTIVWIGAYVETAWVTWSSVWDVNINGATIMTTNKLTIETTETSTTDATTQPTLTTTSIALGDLITIDTDSLSTTKPKGLHVYLLIRLT